MSGATALSPGQLAMAWHSASLLLDFPEESTIDQLALVHRASHLLPDEVGGPLRSAVVHLDGAPLGQLQEEYVATFDAHDLHLGDVDRAGAAGQEALRVRFAQIYQGTGFAPAESERPDHLCVVLRFAATVDPVVGGQVLADHRDHLERLLMSLQKVESGWTGAVAAVAVTLQGADRWVGVRDDRVDA